MIQARLAGASSTVEAKTVRSRTGYATSWSEGKSSLPPAELAGEITASAKKLA